MKINRRRLLAILPAAPAALALTASTPPAAPPADPPWLVTDPAELRHRALLPKGEALPADVRALAEVPDPLRGWVEVLVEGADLPAWHVGCQPFRFGSVAEMEDSRELLRAARRAPLEPLDVTDGVPHWLLARSGGIVKSQPYILGGWSPETIVPLPRIEAPRFEARRTLSLENRTPGRIYYDRERGRFLEGLSLGSST